MTFIDFFFFLIQTLNAISTEQSSTIVFPFPIDTLCLSMGLDKEKRKSDQYRPSQVVGEISSISRSMECYKVEPVGRYWLFSTDTLKTARYCSCTIALTMVYIYRATSSIKIPIFLLNDCSFFKRRKIFLEKLKINVSLVFLLGLAEFTKICLSIQIKQ